MSNPIYFHNGRIRTRPEGTQFTEALLVDEGRVRASGTAVELEAMLPRGTERVELEGATVVPGLIDAHLHLENFSRWLKMVDCEVATSGECLERLLSRASTTPAGDWILGHGWNQTIWGGFKALSDWDEALPNHPAYVTAKSLHAAWANSVALAVAGIDASTPDPDDGVIARHAHGMPTGILFEGATRLITAHIPASDPQEVADDLASAQAELVRLGLTGIHDFDGPSCLRGLQILRERADLRMRVIKNIPFAHLASAKDLGLRSGFGDKWIRIGNIKVFADGALGPRTAAMLQPYDGEPDNRGMHLLDGEALTEIFEQAAEAGFGMTVHAIGDRANHEALNAFGLLREYEAANELPRRRHRIEHLQLLHPEDRARPSELGLVASMQPIHATSDMQMADRYWGSRVAEAYGWRTQLDTGARLAFGSDAPVEPPDPVLGLHAAVTRRLPDGSPGSEGWVPEQRISLAEALAAYTTGPAYAAGTETWQGTLEDGFAADLVVLDRDPFELEPYQLIELKVLGTMVGGEWSFREI